MNKTPAKGSPYEVFAAFLKLGVHLLVGLLPISDISARNLLSGGAG